MAIKVIGKVTATEKKPTTYNTFRFWLSDDEEVRIFDVVRVQHIRESYTYAVVIDLQFITDSAGNLASYVSSEFGDVNSPVPNERLGTTIAEAQVLYNPDDIEMPVKEGALVETADEDGIREALGLVGFNKPIPGGYISMSYGTEVPVEFDASYLVGPEGAHLNISGISGLATKTSYATFLLNSIQQKMGDDVTMILFNVKKNDLLAIDEKSFEELSKGKKEEWERCGLASEPFQNVHYLYPYSELKEDNYYSNTCSNKEFLKKQHEEKRAFNYYYDVNVMVDKMPLLLSDVDDPNITLQSIYDDIKGFKDKDWDEFKREVEKKTRPKSSSSLQSNSPVQSWRRFNRYLQVRTANPLFVKRSLTNQNKRRQRTVSEAVRKLRPGQVLVVDIEPLPDYLQCLVVGDVISTVKDIMVGEDELCDRSELGQHVIIFADELNKYAPKYDSSGRSLTNILLEVTERGRSLGVVLFGAEQFRSGVHDRIIGNCSTNIFGRTSPVEMSKCPDYRYFPEAQKASITRLKKGSLLLQHAVFKTHLIKVNFPFPCYYKEDIA